MSKTRIRIILYMALNTFMLGLNFFFAVYYIPRLPGTLPLSYHEDGSIGGKTTSGSIWVVALVYLGIYLLSILIFKLYGKIKFKGIAEFEKIKDEKIKKPVYDLIKESGLAIAFFLGLIIIYIQTTLVKLGLGKVKKFSYVPLGIFFLLFLVMTFYYNNFINKTAKKIINKATKGQMT